MPRNYNTEADILALQEHVGNYYGNTQPAVQTGALSNYTPLTSLFPTDKNIQRSSESFQSLVSGLDPASSEGVALSNPFNQAFGQSIFDLFTLGTQSSGNDYLGNLLNQSYGSFKEGGKVKKYNVGGLSEPIGIQTEKYKGLKEKIVTPEGDIFDVASTKSHDKMDDDEVTDIVGESYIGSARDKYKITKEEAMDISLGFPIMAYKEGEPIEAPKEMLLSDIMKKKSEKPAELFDNIAKKFKVSNREHDAISEASDAENKEQRIAYLQPAIELIESKKAGKDTSSPNDFPLGGFISNMSSQFFNPLESELNAQSSQSLPSLSLLPSFMNSDNALTGILDRALGNNTKDLSSAKFNPSSSFKFEGGGYSKKKNVPKAFWGALIGLGSTIFNGIQNSNERKAANELYEQNKLNIQQNLDSNLNDLNTGSAARLASILGQDTQYHNLDLSRVSAIGNQGFNDSIQTTRNLYDNNASAIDAQSHNLARTLFNNTSSFGAGVAAASSLLPNTLRARNDNAANESRDLLGIRNAQTNFNISTAQALAEDQQRGLLFEQEGSNQKIAGIGETAVNHVNQRANLTTGAVNANLANSGAQVAARQNFATNQANLVNNAAGILQTLPGIGPLAPGQSNSSPGSTNALLNTTPLQSGACPCREIPSLGISVDCTGKPC